MPPPARASDRAGRSWDGSLGRVSRSHVIYIGLLAAFWGASYMFIKVANRAFEPAGMMLLRLVLASLIIVAVLAAQRGWRASVDDLRRLGWEGFALGVVNGAIPFTLIAWGEQHIDSGVAAIANASMPIFVLLLAIRWNPGEGVAGRRLVRFLFGLVGVGVLAGIHPEGGWWGAAGTLAVVVASVSYAIGSLWGQRLIHRTSGLTLAAASMIGGVLVLLPPGLAQLPSEVPGWKETGSVVALAGIGTALAQILLYRVLRSDGAARVSRVTYLLPGPLLAPRPRARLGGAAARRAADVGGARRDGAHPRRRRARVRRGQVRAPPRAGHGAVAVTSEVSIRRAEPGDVDFLLELMTHEEVDPFMAVVRPRDRDGLLAEIERSQAEPEEDGRFVIEGDGAAAGLMGFEVANRRSKIAHLGSLAVHPDFRGRRVADRAAQLFQRHLIFDLGYHRLQLEIYGFNERAQRHAERAGFVREGVRRKAYDRHGEWVDGVIYGLVREDLET